MDSSVSNDLIHRKRDKPLGLLELIAIALGGMVGGGIFTVLGVSVSLIGPWTPIAIAFGGIAAAAAAYSYIKLGIYYRDEGATYAFVKATFPESPFAASLIGWWVIFGYISTMALYAYTFAAYVISGSEFADSEMMRKVAAGLVLTVFMIVNIWSVKGMGKIEDLMVYSKLLILAVISFILINRSHASLPELIQDHGNGGVFAMLIVASLTFVAYEGFQLVINAVNEMETPEKNIPRAIYGAIFCAAAIYFVIALGAILTIPFEDLIRNKEYALASGTDKVLGHWGTELVIIGALLATSSAISGTVFGASRQMAAIARDGYFPTAFNRRRDNIPVNAIITMTVFAFLLVLAGNLEVILEFGSVTFLLVSLLIAIANFRVRRRTDSSTTITLLSIAILFTGMVLICYYELTHQPEQLLFIGVLYLILTVAAWFYSLQNKMRLRPQ